MCHDSFTYVPWLIHICAMTHSHMCHDSFTYVPWLIHMCNDSFISAMTPLCVPWLIHICAMTNPCAWLVHVCHDLFMYTTIDSHAWLIHMCHDSFMYAVTNPCVHRIHMCLHMWFVRVHHDYIKRMTHPYVPGKGTYENESWHICDSFVYTMTPSCASNAWPIHMCQDSFMCTMTNSYVHRIHMRHDCSCTPWPLVQCVAVCCSVLQCFWMIVLVHHDHIN